MQSAEVTRLGDHGGRRLNWDGLVSTACGRTQDPGSCLGHTETPEGLSATGPPLGSQRARGLCLCTWLLGWELHDTDYASPGPSVHKAEHRAVVLTCTSTGSSDCASSVSRSSMVIITCPLR